MIGQAFHWANLTVAFLLELCALAALCYWGVWTGGWPVTKTALGLGAPLFAAVLWGLFAASRAPVSVPLVGLGGQADRLRLGRRGPVYYWPPRPCNRLCRPRRQQRSGAPLIA